MNTYNIAYLTERNAITVFHYVRDEKGNTYCHSMIIISPSEALKRFMCKRGEYSFSEAVKYPVFSLHIKR